MSTPSPYILTVIFTARITLICLCLVDSSLSMPFISIRYGFSQPSLESIEHVIPFYPFSMNAIIMLPLLPTIRPFVFSYDATHSLGTHSFGIKIDAIPGTFNFTSTIRTIIKGEHRGFCYELRGYGHSSMPIVGMILNCLVV